LMGQPIRPLEPQRIHDAIQLMYLCSITAWVMALAVLFVAWSVFRRG